MTLIDPQLCWPTPGAGYRHHKGGTYIVRCIARMSEKRDEIAVVYWSVGRQELWVRPLGMFTEHVDWPDGRRRPRFTRADRIEDDELVELEKLWAAEEERP
jgi:hypothetical protein